MKKHFMSDYVNQKPSNNGVCYALNAGKNNPFALTENPKRNILYLHAISCLIASLCVYVSSNLSIYIYLITRYININNDNEINKRKLLLLGGNRLSETSFWIFWLGTIDNDFVDANEIADLAFFSAKDYFFKKPVDILASMWYYYHVAREPEWPQGIATRKEVWRNPPEKGVVPMVRRMLQYIVCIVVMLVCLVVTCIKAK